MRNREKVGVVRPPDGPQLPYQICEGCWVNRHGKGVIDHLAGAFQKDPYITPCAICSAPTQSAHFERLLDREVHAKVPVIFTDGPRQGFTGLTLNMATRSHVTYLDSGVPVLYVCELIGAELHARVVPASLSSRSRLRH